MMTDHVLTTITQLCESVGVAFANYLDGPGHDAHELALLAPRLIDEIRALKLRPPMGCYTCEVHNDQLVERIDMMVEAACPACAAAPAFVAAQQWPLPERESVREEEFAELVARSEPAEVKP